MRDRKRHEENYGDTSASATSCAVTARCRREKIKRASQDRATKIFATAPFGCAILPISEAADFFGRLRKYDDHSARLGHFRRHRAPRARPRDRARPRLRLESPAGWDGVQTAPDKSETRIRRARYSSSSPAKIGSTGHYGACCQTSQTSRFSTIAAKRSRRDGDALRSVGYRRTLRNAYAEMASRWCVRQHQVRRRLPGGEHEARERDRLRRRAQPRRTLEILPNDRLVGEV
jgi:hypothetical protein